jgi:hypothetical protein
MKLYQIVAYVTTVSNGWRSTIGVPTFYLREDMQGITNEAHAEQIATTMLRALCPGAVNISVMVGVGTIELQEVG